LAFRGGTALHKLYLTTPGRYSEDVDLVQINAAPIGVMLDNLRQQLDPWLGTPKWKQNQGRVTLFYRFQTETKPVTQARIKIEINTREHFSILGLIKQTFQVENSWFSGNVSLTCYHLEELLGTKLRALYQRKKGRDLFDLYIIYKNVPEFNKQKIIGCFNAYLKAEDKSVSKADFQENLYWKIQDQQFLHDMDVLLPTNGKQAYTHQEAYDFVDKQLLCYLNGDSWKGFSQN